MVIFQGTFLLWEDEVGVVMGVGDDTVVRSVGRLLFL
jgi:hypothetical protein